MEFGRRLPSLQKVGVITGKERRRCCFWRSFATHDERVGPFARCTFLRYAQLQGRTVG